MTAVVSANTDGAASALQCRLCSFVSGLVTKNGSELTPSSLTSQHFMTFSQFYIISDRSVEVAPSRISSIHSNVQLQCMWCLYRCYQCVQRRWGHQILPNIQIVAGVRCSVLCRAWHRYYGTMLDILQMLKDGELQWHFYTVSEVFPVCSIIIFQRSFHRVSEWQ